MLNLYRIENSEKFIFNSFETYLKKEKNFKKFEKFMKHVYETYSKEVQQKMLEKFIENCYLNDYKWLISSRKFIHKKTFNYLIGNFLSRYSKKEENGIFIDNLSKIEKGNLYNSTRKNINLFLNKMKNPTIIQKPKITELIRKFS